MIRRWFVKFLENKLGKNKCRISDWEPPEICSSVAILCNGGAERFSSGLIDELAAAGVEVHIFANKWNETNLPNIHFHHVPTKTTNSIKRVISFSKSVKEIISRENFDLIQSHERTVCQDIYRAGDGCHKEWLIKRKKYNPINGRLSFLNPFHRKILQIEKEIFNSKNYKKIIAISKMVKQNIKDHYQVPDQDIIVVYNGVSLERFRPQNKIEYASKIRRKWDIPKNAVTILMVGSGFERKGLKFLMHSLKYFNASDWRLVVIGKGNWSYYTRYAPRKLRNRLIYLPPPVDDLEKYYAAADIFILPSIYEPFGNAYLEALASGIPTIVSRFSGAAELITHKFNGMILENPGNPEEIAEHVNYLNDKSFRETMGRQGRRLAGQFSIKKNTETMLRLYKKLLTNV